MIDQFGNTADDYDAPSAGDQKDFFWHRDSITRPVHISEVLGKDGKP